MKTEDPCSVRTDSWLLAFQIYHAALSSRSTTALLQSNVASSGIEAGQDAAGETMISGYTGEAFRTDIFIGPVYYQRLRHMVSDKFQVSPSFNKFSVHAPILCSLELQP